MSDQSDRLVNIQPSDFKNVVIGSSDNARAKDEFESDRDGFTQQLMADLDKGGDAAFQDLVASIKNHGQLQPGVVRVEEEAGVVTYHVVAGQRRFWACYHLGIPFKVTLYSSALDARGASFDENVVRSDMTLREKISFLRGAKKDGMTQSAIAKKMGIANSTVSEILKMDRLPPAVVEEVSQGLATTSEAKELLPLLGEDKKKLSEDETKARDKQILEVWKKTKGKGAPAVRKAVTAIVKPEKAAEQSGAAADGEVKSGTVGFYTSRQLVDAYKRAEEQRTDEKNPELNFRTLDEILPTLAVETEDGFVMADADQVRELFFAFGHAYLASIVAVRVNGETAAAPVNQFTIPGCGELYESRTLVDVWPTVATTEPSKDGEEQPNDEE